MKISLSIALTLLLVGCSSQESETEVQEVQQNKIVKEVKSETVVKAIEKVEESLVPVVKTGEMIYKACVSCHGASAEKKALGKSQVIKGWSASKISDALNGYKIGSYGGSMKGLMKGQVSNLSDTEIELVSNYISEF
ncbi:MAG: hypothetical protein U9N02_09175 [Campylobacterota bacterium]|nr:hypothetical protein [Campylobacterota bacterium]